MEGITTGDGTEGRVNLACKTCQKSKRKCDGVQPVCSLCLRLGKECSYSERLPRKKRKFVDEEYIHSLELENEQLRRKIEALSTSIDEHPGAVAAGSKEEVNLRSNDIPPGRKDDVNAASVDSMGLSLEMASQSAIDEVSSMIWRLNIGPEGEPSFVGPSGGVYFPGIDIETPSSKVNTEFQARAEMNTPCCPIDSDVEEHLIECFMYHVARYYGFVHPRTILANGDLYEDEDVQFYWKAACAAGSCYSELPGAKAIGDSLAALLESTALIQCRSHPCELTVLALSVLAWRELSLGQESMGWMYNSMAAALAIHLGLHVLSLAPLSANSAGDTSARSLLRIQTFWSCFLIERIGTTDLGRHCNIPWNRVKTPLYACILDQSASIESIAFAHQCELWNLHDTHMDQIYSFTFHDSDLSRKAELLRAAHEALNGFYNRIDPRVQPSTHQESSTLCCVIYFHMSYYNSSLLIHRPFLRLPNSQSIDARMVARTVWEAAEACSRLIRLHHKRIGGFQKAPPFLIQHFLAVGIILLSQATAGKEFAGRKPANHLRVCLLALEEMQSTWPLKAHRAIEVLRQIAYRWSVVWALPMKFSHPLSIAALKPTTTGFIAGRMTEYAGFGGDGSGQQSSHTGDQIQGPHETPDIEYQFWLSDFQSLDYGGMAASGTPDFTLYADINETV